MELLFVAVLAILALLKFRMARAIARSPAGQGRYGRWTVRMQQALGLLLLAGALFWVVWRRLLL